MLPDRFHQLAAEIISLAAEHGVKIRAAENPGLPHFHRLSEIRRGRVLELLETQARYLRLAQKNGRSPDDPAAVWDALVDIGYILPPDLKGRIRHGDTLEIYSTDGAGLFKNLRFWHFITMTLEEVFCLPWTALMKFSTRQFFFFVEMALLMKMGRHDRRGFEPTFNRYTVHEKRGEKRGFDIHLTWVAPLDHQTGEKALLFINRSKFAEEA